MDPNTTLAELRRLMDNYDAVPIIEHADRMGAAMRDLDEWLSKGGSLPDAWRERVIYRGK